nr:MAG: hypothetical protein [Hainan jingmen-like virus]
MIRRYADSQYDQAAVVRFLTDEIVGTNEFAMPEMAVQMVSDGKINLETKLLINLYAPTLCFLFGLTLCKYSRIFLAIACYILNYKIFCVAYLITVVLSFVWPNRTTSAPAAEMLDERRKEYLAFAVTAAVVTYGVLNGGYSPHLAYVITVSALLASLVVVLPTIRLHSARDWPKVIILVLFILIILAILVYGSQYTFMEFIMWIRVGCFLTSVPRETIARMATAYEYTILSQYATQMPYRVMRNFLTESEMDLVYGHSVPAVDENFEWNLHIAYFFISSVGVTVAATMAFYMSVREYTKKFLTAQGDAGYQNAEFDYNPRVVIMACISRRPIWLSAAAINFLVYRYFLGWLATSVLMVWFVVSLYLAYYIWSYLVKPVALLEGTNTTRAPADERVGDAANCSYLETVQSDSLRMVIMIGAAAQSLLIAFGLGYTNTCLVPLGSAVWFYVKYAESGGAFDTHASLLIAVGTLQPGMLLHWLLGLWVQIPSLWSQTCRVVLRRAN